MPIKLQYQQSASPPPQPATPVTLTTFWFLPLSEPVLRGPQKQVLKVTVAASPNAAAVLESWFAPFSTPVVTRSLHISRQQPLAYVPLVSPAVLTITVDSWLTPLSERLYGKPGLHASGQQAFAFSPLPIPAVIIPVSVYNWGWQSLAMPRFPFGFPSMLQMFTGSLGPIVPIPNPPQTEAIYTVSGGPVDDRYPASGVSWIPPTGLATQKRTL